MLVGRDAELALFERSLADVRNGANASIAVVGEPGIGKSRLLLEACELARAAGFETLIGRGSELEQTVPFSLMVDALEERLRVLEPQALRRLGDERWADLASVLPSLASAGGGLTRTPTAERHRAHHAIRAALEELAHDRPLLLALDDAHWADPASLKCVSHMMRRRMQRSMLLLACRPHQTPACVLRELSAMSRDGAVRTVELAPLSLADANALLARDLDEASIRTLHADSGGNPFYLEELAQAWLAERPCRQPDVLMDTEAPRTIQHALAEEIDILSRPARRVLDAAAVVGEPVQLDLVAELADQDRPAALRALDELIAVDLLRTTDILGQIVFRHPIVQRAVYASTQPGWRMNAHARAAHALQEDSARAHHIARSAAKGDAEAIAALAKAGEAALPRAPACAERWFDAALRLLPDTASAERRLPLLMARATALTMIGRLRGGRAVLSVAAHALPASMTAERRRITAMLAGIEQDLGETTEARRLLEDALACTEPPSAEAAQLTLQLAHNQMTAGEWEDAARTALEARSLARALGDRPLFLSATASTAWIALYRGELDEGKQHREEAAGGIDKYPDEQLRGPLLEALLHLGCTELAEERFESAGAHLDRGLRVCRATGQTHLLTGFANGLAGARMWQGRLREARATADLAAEASQLLDNDQSLATAQALRCWAAARQGDLGTALTAGEEAVRAAERVPRSLNHWLAHACLAEALLESGRYERCRRELVAAGGPELAAIAPTFRAPWERLLVEAEVAAGHLDAADAVAARLEAGADRLDLRLQEGAARYARACVLLAGGEHAQAAEVALLAAATYDGAGAPIDAARARLAAGRALALDGDADGAAIELEAAHSVFAARGAERLANRAARELRRLGARVAARGTHLAAVPAGPAALSRRELEVAQRIMLGHTNRQIAAELYVSEKTIEKHVTHVFGKFGVSSRAAVAAVMARWRASDQRAVTG